MQTPIHHTPFARRMMRSLVGSLIALTGFSAYQDTSAMVSELLHRQDKEHAVVVSPDDEVQRVKAFAETLKQQRADMMQK